MNTATAATEAQVTYIRKLQGRVSAEQANQFDAEAIASHVKTYGANSRRLAPGWVPFHGIAAQWKAAFDALDHLDFGPERREGLAKAQAEYLAAKASIVAAMVETDPTTLSKTEASALIDTLKAFA